MLTQPTITSIKQLPSLQPAVLNIDDLSSLR